MCCASPEVCDTVAPNYLQGLVCIESSTAFQCSRKDHFGSMLCTQAHTVGDFCIDLMVQSVHVNRGGTRLNGASKPLELEILIKGLKEQLEV